MEIKNSSSNLTWHEGKVTYEERCAILKQLGLVVWFTGLSGAGKSTIAVEVEKLLIQQGKAAYRLDGDNIRHGLNADLGFSESDRNENIRRITEVAVLFKDAGVITLVAFITPFQKMRVGAREKIGQASYLEVYLKADVATCAARDPKGLYAKAQEGQITNFTGLSSKYEEPHHPDLILDTTKLTITESVTQVMKLIKTKIKI